MSYANQIKEYAEANAALSPHTMPILVNWCSDGYIEEFIKGADCFEQALGWACDAAFEAHCQTVEAHMLDD